MRARLTEPVTKSAGRRAYLRVRLAPGTPDAPEPRATLAIVQLLLAIAIVVAKTGDDPAARHRNYSLILVPTDTPGWEVVRDPDIMGAHFVGGLAGVALATASLGTDVIGHPGVHYAVTAPGPPSRNWSNACWSPAAPGTSPSARRRIREAMEVRVLCD